MSPSTFRVAIVVLCALGLALLGADIGPAPGACDTLSGESLDTTSDVNYVSAGGREMLFMFEPDTSGAGTGAEVSLQSCTDADADTCGSLTIIDSDGNGIADTNVMTGAQWQRGTKEPVGVAGFVQVSVDVAPSAGQTPKFQACSTKMNR